MLLTTIFLLEPVSLVLTYLVFPMIRRNPTGHGGNRAGAKMCHKVIAVACCILAANVSAGSPGLAAERQNPLH